MKLKDLLIDLKDGASCVLKDVYFTILLDSDLFVKFKNFLDERGVNRG